MRRRRIVEEKLRARAVALLKADPARPDRWVARSAGCHHSTVARYRAALAAVGELEWDGTIPDPVVPLRSSSELIHGREVRR